MAKQTSANMQPCKGGAAERHNRREKELEYVRKDLTHLNHYKEWTSIAAQMNQIRSEYEAATGQKLQATAQPIQEIVLVIDYDTSIEQVERFCELIKNLGMTPLSYAIHKDEGHTDATTGEWIPNYHAHIIVDTTCWEHRQVERTKKKNGKNINDPKTGKPVKIMVDAYAKTIKFSRSDMRKLQDYAAEATGLERGVSSERMHEEARQYKAREQAREIEKQAHELEVIQQELTRKGIELANQVQEIESQHSTIECQRQLIDAQSMAINDLNMQVETHERIIRSGVAELQNTGRKVVSHFDEQAHTLSQNGISLDKGITERRDWLKSTSEEDLSTAPLQRIVRLLHPLSNAITIVAWTASVIASTLADAYAKTIQGKKQVLSALTRQIKEQTLWKSTKRAFLSLLNRPADKQAEEQKAKIDAAQNLIDLLRIDVQEKEQKIRGLKHTIDGLKLEKSKKDGAVQQHVSTIDRLRTEKQSLQHLINNLQNQLQEKHDTLRSWHDDFIGIAQTLVDNAGPGLLSRYEEIGLHRIIGENIWQEAIDTKLERLDQDAHEGLQL